MLYAYPVDDECPDTCEDRTIQNSGMEVADDATYADVMALFAKRWEEQQGEPYSAEEAYYVPRFWLVNEQAHKAALAVPDGDWDSQNMRHIAIRKTVLQTGIVRELRPEAVNVGK